MNDESSSPPLFVFTIFGFVVAIGFDLDVVSFKYKNGVRITVSLNFS